MTLPSSFPISVSQINVELGRNATDPFDIQGTAERALAEVPSGAISFSDFLGKEGQGASWLGGTDLGSGASPSGSVNIGTANSHRRIAIVVHWREGSSHFALNSATIGGVSATIHKQGGQTGGVTGLGVAIISALVPTGTTATVALTFSGAQSDAWVETWRLIKFDTVVDTGSDFTQVTAGPLSVTVNTTAPRFVLGGYTGSTNTNTFSITWTNLAEQYDTGVGVRIGGAHDIAGGSGSLTVGATQGVISNSGNNMVVVSWTT